MGIGSDEWVGLGKGRVQHLLHAAGFGSAAKPIPRYMGASRRREAPEESATRADSQTYPLLSYPFVRPQIQKGGAITIPSGVVLFGLVRCLSSRKKPPTNPTFALLFGLVGSSPPYLSLVPV